MRIALSLSLACACLLSSPVAMAIDKGDLTGLRASTAERVLASFEGPAYYILTSDGNSEITVFEEKPAFATLDFKYTLVLFLNPADVSDWSKRSEKQTQLRYQVKEWPIRNIMAAQYRTVDKPVSADKETPDFILVETMARARPVVETLRQKGSMEPFVCEKDGKRFVPAFFSREDALACQQAVNRAGNGEYDRVGLDIRTHLAYVESRLDSDAPVITLGYGGYRELEPVLKSMSEASATAPQQDKHSNPVWLEPGPRYVNKEFGFSISFPDGWKYHTFDDGKPWMLDASDGKVGLISIGFSEIPAGVSAEQIRPDLMAERMAAAEPTKVMLGAGRGEIGGKKGVWHKYTGDLPMTNGKIRMTAIHYLVPLGDGRALDFRLAALPEKFDDLAGALKESMKSFRWDESVTHQ